MCFGWESMPCIVSPHACGPVPTSKWTYRQGCFALFGQFRARVMPRSIERWFFFLRGALTVRQATAVNVIQRPIEDGER